MAKKPKTFFQKHNGTILVLLIIAFVCFGWYMWGQIDTQIKQMPGYYNTYECDNDIVDECRKALITKGGTWLKDCKSGKEHVCQTVTETP